VQASKNLIKEGKDMKKILCIAVVCIMAIVFASSTDVSALDLEKIQNTDWDTKVTSKWYDAASGNYVGAGVGQSVARILSNNVQISAADFVDSVFANWYLRGGTGLINYTYNPNINRLKSTECSLLYTDLNNNTVYSYSGLCDAKITFTTTTTGITFEGTITFTDTVGGRKNITAIKGKKLGKFIPSQIE
jgi:opacity protein-like surface antigen